MKVAETGEACNVDWYPFSHQTLSSLSLNVDFILFSLFPLPYTTLVQDFVFSHVDYGRTLLTNLTDSCLSLLKAILLTITRLISLKQYFLNVITFPEILKIDNQALKKYHLAPTLQSHSFLPTLSNKLP